MMDVSPWAATLDWMTKEQILEMKEKRSLLLRWWLGDVEDISDAHAHHTEDQPQDCDQDIIPVS